MVPDDKGDKQPNGQQEREEDHYYKNLCIGTEKSHFINSRRTRGTSVGSSHDLVQNIISCRVITKPCSII